MARRRRRRKSTMTDLHWLLAGGGVLLAAGAAVRVIREHPLAVSLVGLAAVSAIGGWVYLRYARARRLADNERNVAVTDHMTGAQFEQYVARLLRDGGCRQVKVCGGAGDMGADVIAHCPQGRRLVVQCKRYKGSLGSPDVQRFAGTARDIHHADVALLVTTGKPSAPAWDVARRCRITLVDRTALAQWISTSIPPIENWPPVANPRQKVHHVRPTDGDSPASTNWWSTP